MTPEQRKASFAELVQRLIEASLDSVTNRVTKGMPASEAVAPVIHLRAQVLSAYNGLCDCLEDAREKRDAAGTPRTPPPGWHSHQCGHAGCSMVWYGPGTQRDGDRCEMHAGQP